ncbi:MULTISPECIES: UPF0489 family protein [unclassified Polaromonas]|uniref:UPF0489 family protein n=1 Tax=unclassified Polaromonas TaxID=2638319 RepID=UPI000F09366D|nr:MULTISPECIES: UPF0489 family protein [unclassified Polaromonas]AYQ28188.1 hypothetical protein DT070_09295 [Polaromonas sp. SP1]QGJ16949.1 hypothetical protein F7R28_00120 [Polaromonas sp. Pch-P]
MALTDFYDLRQIRGKRVYIVDDHHKALAAWAVERRALERPPTLITVDHHMDTDDSFRKYAFLKTEGAGEDEEIEAIRAEQLAKLNRQDDASLAAAIDILAHDEHIQAAVACGILVRSFSIQLSDGGGSDLGETRRDGLYVISHRCAIGCEKRTYDEECARHHSDQIIESTYLEDQLVRANALAASIGLPTVETQPYILDIDLDCFHSWSATQPRDDSTLRRLMAGALAITIATEPKCVEELWLDDKCAPDHASILSRLLARI